MPEPVKTETPPVAQARLVLDPVKVALWVLSILVVGGLIGGPIYLAYCRIIWYWTTKLIQGF